MAHVNPSKYDREQARIIRAAQANGRTILAWSASVAGPAGEPRAILLYAVTDRAAASLAGSVGTVLRVGPANVRDLPGAIARALDAVPAPVACADAPRVSAPVPLSSRALARQYLRGVAERPADAAVYAVLGSVAPRRAHGEPRKGPLVGVPRHVGAPIVGEYTLTGGRRAA